MKTSKEIEQEIERLRFVFHISGLHNIDKPSYDLGQQHALTSILPLVRELESSLDSHYPRNLMNHE